MTIRFTAHSTWVDNNVTGYDRVSAIVSETDDKSRFTLYFEASLSTPDERDAAEGEDTYCLITHGQKSAYGCVTEVALRNRVLRVVIAPHAQEPLGLNDTEIEASLHHIDEHALEQLRLALRYILTYGRTDATPAVMDL
ncbi:hypothetical protein Lfu02_79560 [Longispora fulva]|uniref:Immunity protein 10 of polymorphic toxin system n=1 Tax=Longispora fulva TaxID=619741 RepID=A0A8J7G987_9ACTN|nr:Imm10 family immunity protein [Longispora fulva]MBG6133989.1 hypothetical protein [Longispora fulva]GIG63584.1 hypothetical protein Lfu02_79560 [Longispora fulva]